MLYTYSSVFNRHRNSSPLLVLEVHEKNQNDRFFFKPHFPFFYVFTTSIPTTRTQPCKLDWKWYFLYLESTKVCACTPCLQPSTRSSLQIEFFDFKNFCKKVSF